MNEVGVTEVQDPEQSPRDFKRSSLKNGALPPLNLSPRSPRKRTESMNAKSPKLDSKSPVKEKNTRLSLKSTSSDKFPVELLDSPGTDEIKPKLPRFFLILFNTFSEFVLCGKLKIEEEKGVGGEEEERNLTSYYAKLGGGKLFYFLDKQDEEVYGMINLTSRPRSRSNSEVGSGGKRNSQKFFGGLKERRKSGFGLFKKAIEEAEKEKEKLEKFEKITLNEVIESTPKKDPLFQKSYKFSIQTYESKRKSIDAGDKTFTFSVDSDEKRSVWEYYIGCFTQNKPLRLENEVYTVMDQFAPFVSLFQRISHSNLLEFFNLININKITDSMVLSLIVICDYYDMDVVRLIKLGIDQEIEANSNLTLYSQFKKFQVKQSLEETV
jgi:hypothetical protein